jgi:anti-sigma regulatory factor (Ser/Thr protein kinase)
VLIAVLGNNLAALCEALGNDVGAVKTADMTESARNPGRILGGLLRAFADQHRNRAVLMIGERVWPTRTAVEYPACVQHETLINMAFEGRGLTIVCPYDAAHLRPRALADARMTHPVLWPAGSSPHHSPDYAPRAAFARYNEPLPSDPVAVTYTVRKLADLSGARRCATRYARLLGLSPDAITDLQLIATELASNSVQHADAPCRLAFWQRDENLVCEARDTGQLNNPLAGRRPPPPDAAAGRGLFLVNALADLVRTHTCRDGTTIQAYLRFDHARRDAA